MRKKRKSLNVFDATEIVAKYTGANDQVSLLAREYDVSEESIYNVLRGEFFDAWAHRELKNIRNTAAMPVE